MTHQKTSVSRRSFLKSSALAGGGLMISFSAFSKFGLADKINGAGVLEQWNDKWIYQNHSRQLTWAKW